MTRYDEIGADGAVTLPAFSLLDRQPRVPHVARIQARVTAPNEHGVPIMFTVWVSRRGSRWWIEASFDGLRMSNTLTTTSEARADRWAAAVLLGRVRIAEEA